MKINHTTSELWLASHSLNILLYQSNNEPSFYHTFYVSHNKHTYPNFFNITFLLDFLLLQYYISYCFRKYRETTKTVTYVTLQIAQEIKKCF